MKSAVEQLSKYAEYHRDRRNIATHLVGVPMIVLAVVVLLSRPAWPLAVAGFTVALSPALPIAALACVYYLRLHRLLGALLTVLLAGCLLVGARLAAGDTSSWLLAGVGLFVVGWVIQFVGHWFEGRKPAFVDDVIGLLIGPIFVLAEALFLCGALRDLQRSIEARAGPTRAGPMPLRQH